MTTREKIQEAGKAGQLLPGTVENLAVWLDAGLPDWARMSIDQLIARSAWSELNDRFYRVLAFGTGGMRGRTIGAVSTDAERGDADPEGSPAHAAIGSNMLNDFTLIRATIGLFRYASGYLKQTGIYAPPQLVIAHDVRHFSRHFCELAASTWTRLGGIAYIFDGPRSTPQLSFSVRWLKAHCGAVITASHNPPHDNGFKAYFADGGQVIAPHDRGIVDEVNRVPLSELGAFLEKDLSRVVVLGRSADDAYMAIAANAVLDPSVFRKARVKIAFTNIHGTGAVAGVPLLLHAGCEVHTVREQLDFDAHFPTVKSPNPENAAALERAVALAEAKGLDVVLATDPDCDRMGCAVRNRAGHMELITGNQIGSLLAEYRLIKAKELGLLPSVGSKHAALVTTYVTTSLQVAIGQAHGVKVVQTLTGYKWIAAKLLAYEQKLREALLREQGIALDYDATPFAERMKLMLEHSTFCLLGTEESYGYMPNDSVRDKDGNTACLMFAEMCAWLKSRGLTVPEFLDEIYLKYGFYLEGVVNIYYEGATGAAKIARILETYRSKSPRDFGGVAVTRFQDFGRETILDADGVAVPRQDLYVITLANGYSFAARGSGTEPKMKFYIFAHENVANAAELPAAKQRAKSELARLAAFIEADAKARAEG